MQIWQIVSLSLLPTVTAKCQSYSQAQQVFHYFQLSCYCGCYFWIAGSFALVLVTSYFIMANVFLFGQPQEAQPARRHTVTQSASTYLYVYIHVGIPFCFCFSCIIYLYIYLYIYVHTYSRKCQPNVAKPTHICNTKIHGNIKLSKFFRFCNNTYPKKIVKLLIFLFFFALYKFFNF